MTVSFTDYAASAAAREHIVENVTKYAHMLCDALGQNAPKDYHFELSSTGRSITRFTCSSTIVLIVFIASLIRKLVPFINLRV